MYDKYVFVYCDSRLFDGVLANQPDAYYQNDNTDIVYTNFQPLVEIPKTSLPNNVLICCFAASNLSLSSCVTVVPKLFSNSSNSLKAYKGEIKFLMDPPCSAYSTPKRVAQESSK